MSWLDYVLSSSYYKAVERVFFVLHYSYYNAVAKFILHYIIIIIVIREFREVNVILY